MRSGTPFSQTTLSWGQQHAAGGPLLNAPDTTISGLTSAIALSMPHPGTWGITPYCLSIYPTVYPIAVLLELLGAHGSEPPGPGRLAPRHHPGLGLGDCGPGGPMVSVGFLGELTISICRPGSFRSPPPSSSSAPAYWVWWDGGGSGRINDPLPLRRKLRQGQPWPCLFCGLLALQ